MIDNLKRLGNAALVAGLLLGGIYGWLYALIGLVYMPNTNQSIEENRYNLIRVLFGLTVLIGIGGLVMLANTGELSKNTTDVVVTVLGSGLCAGMPAFFIGVGTPQNHQQLQTRIRINAIAGLVLAIGGIIYGAQ